MSRFARALVTFLTVLSAALSVAALVTWIAAQRHAGYVEWATVDEQAMRDRMARVWFGRSAVRFDLDTTTWRDDGSTLRWYRASGRVGWHWYPLKDLPNVATWGVASPTRLNRIGFRWDAGSTLADPHLLLTSRRLVLPYWFLAALAAAPAASLAWRRHRQRRTAPGGFPVQHAPLSAAEPTTLKSQTPNLKSQI